MTSNIIITGETEHFHYRVRKGGVYLDAQREHIAFGYTDDEVFLSLDCGKPGNLMLSLLTLQK